MTRPTINGHLAAQIRVMTFFKEIMLAVDNIIVEMQVNGCSGQLSPPANELLSDRRQYVILRPICIYLLRFMG